MPSIWSLSDTYQCDECGDALAYRHDAQGWITEDDPVVCSSPTCRASYRWSLDDETDPTLTTTGGCVSEAEHVGILFALAYMED